MWISSPWYSCQDSVYVTFCVTWGHVVWWGQCRVTWNCQQPLSRRRLSPEHSSGVWGLGHPPSLRPGGFEPFLWDSGLSVTWGWYVRLPLVRFPFSPPQGFLATTPTIFLPIGGCLCNFLHFFLWEEVKWRIFISSKHLWGDFSKTSYWTVWRVRSWTSEPSVHWWEGPHSGELGTAAS